MKLQNPRSYLSYDSLRIGSAYELMSGLRLIDMNDGINVTAVGRKVLRKLRTYHQAMLGQMANAASAYLPAR